MNITVTVKSPSRRKSGLIQQTLSLPSAPAHLRQLIGMIVQSEIQRFKDKQETSSLMPYLTAPEIENSAHTGKIGFDDIVSEAVPDEQQALDAAWSAFEDGLYRVFIREQEWTNLDEALDMQEGDTIVFVRLVMLSGRLW
ncbi:hypothetical protein [Paenibacillus sp. WLX2291]|uniref:hypothetical protein n=1 Tax=Paenibacillus sp. WLX2291 TaxID=3296934 RepID=UPI0039842E80